MIFDFFSKKVQPIKRIDKIFMDSAAKEAACVQLALQDSAVIFICWFPGTATAFKTLFATKGISTDRIVEARNFHTGKSNGHTPVFLEHFPLAATELELIKNWNITQVDIYSALDEPLLQRFGGEEIRNMLLKMGVKPDEIIEHPLVSKAIENARKKLAEKVNFPSAASSQAEWFLKNTDR